jgi:hypothetical protein
LRELVTGTDVELAVDAAEVKLDRLGRYEQRFGDLPRGQSASGQLRDSLLADGQGPSAAELCPAGPRSGGDQLSLRSRGELARSPGVAELEGPEKRRTSVDPSVGAPQRGTQLDQGLDPLQTRRGRIAHLCRFSQQVQSGAVVASETEDPQVAYLRARNPDPPGI